MNEDIPPQNPPEPPATPPPSLPPTSPPRVGLNPWQGGGIGLLVFVVCVLLCYFNPLILLFGFVGVVVCLFFKGYRSIFLGYIISAGVALLAAIIYCSTQPFDIK